MQEVEVLERGLGVAESASVCGEVERREGTGMLQRLSLSLPSRAQLSIN